jgi:protocatechuate 3,4-dioxygenase alpha subunit
VADNQTSELFGQTPWQTLGPFFHYALPWKGGADLVGGSDLGARPELMPSGHDLLHRTAPRGQVDGDRIEIEGRVLDGAGEPLADAMVEIWQADAQGRYENLADAPQDAPRDPQFVGFGRAATQEDGSFRFRTIRPGRVPGPGNSLQAAHIAVAVLGRGLIKRLVTRLYFEGGEGVDDDPVLTLVPAARRATLIARRTGEAAYRFDIRLQGEHETVFFDI